MTLSGGKENEKNSELYLPGERQHERPSVSLQSNQQLRVRVQLDSDSSGEVTIIKQGMN